MALTNDLVLRAARGESVERTPVWLMRQAGRVLPEYRAVRSRMGGFKELVESPEFACEVTIQPVDILGVDAAIIFSDILVIPEAMGLSYQMEEKRGPWFASPIRTEADVARMRIATANDVPYTIRAIELTKRSLNNRVPLIGFAGAPWTIFSYMVEGSGSKTFSTAKRMLYQRPDLAHQLLHKITESTVNYLNGQIDAGADMVQVFDSWAGVLGPDLYREFALPYLSTICDRVTRVPVTVFAKGAHFVREDLGRLNCATIGLDWEMDIAESRALIGPQKILQGNADPCLLYAPDAVIVVKTHTMLQQFGPQRHIANLGHGLYPDLEVEKVKLFVDTVKAYRHG